MPNSGGHFQDSYNRRRFREQGEGGEDAELIYGRLGGNVKGTTSTEGRIIIDEALERHTDLESDVRHEMGHRRLRPARYPQPKRRELGERIGRLLERSHIIKTLDEVIASGYQYDDQGAARLRELFSGWFRFPKWHKGYAVTKREALREFSILRREEGFRELLEDPDEFLRLLEEDRFDLEHFIERLERFHERIERYRRQRMARPGGESLKFP